MRRKYRYRIVRAENMRLPMAAPDRDLSHLFPDLINLESETPYIDAWNRPPKAAVETWVNREIRHTYAYFIVDNVEEITQ